MSSDTYMIERPVVRSQDDKKLKIILAAIIIILSVQLIWLLGMSPRMPLAKISIYGASGFDEALILVIAGIDSNSSYMSINAVKAEEALLELPAVHSAQVIKRFPNRIELYIESRRPAAMTFISNGIETMPVLIDRNGTIFCIGKENITNNETLPLISGLVLDDIYPGMKLPRIYDALFTRLEILRQQAPELLATISEIKINHNQYDGFDLTLFPVHRNVRVRVSDDITEETIRYMLLMLDVLSATSASIGEIDFRTGTASYKEAFSG